MTLYESQIWKTAIKYKHNEKRMESLKRKMALRIPDDRKASATAILVVKMPLKLKIEEQTEISVLAQEHRATA